MTTERSSSSSSGGIGFVGLLTIAFIVLKLTGYIDWSWWWVLSPVWISASLAIVVLILLFVGWLVGDALKQRRRNRRNERVSR